MRIHHDDSPIDIAAICVAGAIRPRTRESIIRNASWPNRDRDDVVYSEISDAMADNTLAERTQSWWASTGANLTAALVSVTDVNEGLASHLIGASLHAHILAGDDTAADNVLRLAERAASWWEGHTAVRADLTLVDDPDVPGAP